MTTPDAHDAPRDDAETDRLLLQAVSGYAVVRLDPHGNVVAWNERAERVLGYTAGEAVGRPGSLFFTEEDRRRGVFEQELRTAAEREQAIDESWLARKDGSVFWAAGTTVPLRDEAGALTGFAKVFRDLSERKTAEEALREQGLRLRAALAAARMGTWFLDIPANRQNLDENLHRLLGVPPGRTVDSLDEFLGFIHPDDRASVSEAFRRSVEEGAELRVEFRVVCRDGKNLWLRDQGDVVLGEDGRPQYLTGACVDITERKAAEQALLDREERLRELNEDLELRVADRTAELAEREGRLRALAAELSRAEQAERRRLSIVLHEHVQQLLVGAQMQIGIVADDSRDPAHRQPLRKGLDVIGEALRTCRSLAVELSPPVLHDQGLAAALAWLCGRMRENYRLPAEFASDGEAEVQGEELRELLFHAARELLLNVVKHARAEKARVRLTRPEPGRVRLEVEDEGGGFDPRSADVEQRSRQSFGLFHIRERLRHVGGGLEIDSAPGRGTRVRLTAPESVHTPDPRGSDGTRPGTSAGSPDGDGRPDGAAKVRVLIVDDHAIVREGLTSVLARELDFLVVGEAADGQAAVEVARVLKADVVLMDVSLPGINGVAATHQITMTLPGVRVIGLSAHEEEETARTMLTAGAVSYLTKGGPSADLVAAIRAAAGRV